MGLYWKPIHIWIEEHLELLFANEEKRNFLINVPKNCRQCELLGICRDNKNNWNCLRGCLILNKSKDYTIPLKINTRKKLFAKKLPVKRLVITGSRKYDNYIEAKEYINHCISNIRKKYRIIIISGSSRGADKLGEQYATENGFEIERYYPDWNKYGKSAGLIKNRLIAEKSDYIICFWDGKSRETKYMIKYAHLFKKSIKIKIIQKD